MTFEPNIAVTVVEEIGTVTISNPARHNALTTRMMVDLGTALRTLDADGEVRAVVLRGEGTQAFAAGADISEFEAHQTSDTARANSDRAVSHMFQAVNDLDTPLVALIHGHCLGAGLALALGADLRIATEDSRFGIPAARLGIGYPVALTQALVRTVGPAHAADLLYTGRTWTVDEALSAGLVNRQVPTDLVDETVAALVEAIAANAPLSIRAAKASIRSVGQPELTSRAATLVAACMDSQDAREGQRAFVEKRAPVFRGV